MINWEKIGKTLSVIGIVFHTVVFGIVLVASFLPFCEGKNFYTSFCGSFGKFLGGAHPFIILFVLLMATVVSFYTVKKSYLWIVTGILTFVFFLIVMFPYSFEVAIVSLVSFGLDGGPQLSDYGTGFEIMSRASNAIYFDVFMIVSGILCSIMAERNADV